MRTLQLAAVAVVLLATCAAAHRGLRQVTPSVVGGQSAPKTRFAYQVGIVFGNVKKAPFFGCGGSLVREDVVLTAGHCTVKATKANTVFAGAYTPPPNNDGVAYNIKRVLYHPLWKNLDPPQYDMTLLFLSTCVTTAGPNGARPAKLASPSDLASTGASLTYYFSGFGTTSDGAGSDGSGGDNPPDLQYGIGKAASSCPDLSSFDEPASAFCVTGNSAVDGGRVPTQDTCQGDSGGPNMINVVAPANAVTGDPTGAGDRIAGITSYGEGCGQRQNPGYYTSVPFFYDFLQTNIDGAKKPCGSNSFNYTRMSNDTNWGGVKPNQSFKLKTGGGVADCATKCQNLKKGCAAFGLSIQTTAKADIVFCDIYWFVVPFRLCDDSLDSKFIPCGRRSGSKGAFRVIWT